MILVCVFLYIIRYYSIIILDNFIIDILDIANILASQFLELILPMNLSSPNSSIHFQGETLEFVITNIISNIHLYDHYLLSL